MDYRERIYQNYVSRHWQYTHSLKKEEYIFYAKIAQKRFRPLLSVKKDADIVDVACGGGHFLYFLQKEGYQNTRGIDLSQEQLNTAGAMGIKNLQRADMFDYLPKHREKFDVIVAFDILEHLRKDEVFDFLDIVYQALKPGGQVLIGVPNVQCLSSGAARYCDFTHEQGFTPSSLAQVLRAGNFKQINIYGEEPVVHDLRSFTRAVGWSLLKTLLKFCRLIESGTGRGFWKKNDILEPRMFALGSK